MAALTAPRSTACTTYTACGKVDVSTDAAGIVIDTDYDRLGRPIARDENGEGISTWEWDTIRIGMREETERTLWSLLYETIPGHTWPCGESPSQAAQGL